MDVTIEGHCAPRYAPLKDALRANFRDANELGAALAVHVETAPCHIAALPVAVNLGCSAMRSVTVEVP